MNSAQDIAFGYLQHEVVLDTVMTFGASSLSVWKTRSTMPEMCVAVCENESEVFIVSNDLAGVTKLLKVIRPDVSDKGLMVHLLLRVLPSHLLLLNEESLLYMRDRTGDWPSPTNCGGRFVSYCNDWASGSIIELSIQHDYTLSTSAVGRGIRGIGVR